MKAIIFLVFFLLIFPFAYAQKQGNIWYFGNNAGLDFNTSPPTALVDGKVQTGEGCATIADKNGKLLFYTDGSTIWNRAHTIMPNGTNLGGNSSSTQSGVIVPFPKDPNKYYVFSVDINDNALVYAVVQFNNDNGSVISKRNLLLPKSNEKIVSVLHTDKQRIWVVAHQADSRNYYAWLIDDNGISANPVITSIGSLISGYEYEKGYFRCSASGQLLALACYGGSFVDISSFNASTGVISNTKTVSGFGSTGPYGLEFSPSEKYLYITEAVGATSLYQVKLPVESGTVIQRGTIISKGSSYGALQLAPNGIIYGAQYDSAYLNAILNPDGDGTACNFRSDYQFLGNKRSTFGLPNFIQSYFQPVQFLTSGSCSGKETSFSLSAGKAAIDSVIWDFGDITSAENTSRLKAPIHIYHAAGSYVVKLRIFEKGIDHMTEQNVVINKSPQPALGKDTVLLYGQVLRLKATDAGSTYLWNDGSTGDNLIVSKPGTYWVKVKNIAGCEIADTVNVSYDQPINVGLKRDTLMCKNSSIKLNVQQEGLQYRWSTGETTPSVTITEAGIYWVELTNAYGNRKRTDTIKVLAYEPSKITTQKELILCERQPVELKASGAGSYEIYTWYDQNMQVIAKEKNGVYKTRLITSDTRYYVSTSQANCTGELVAIDILVKKPVAAIEVSDSVVTDESPVQMKASGGNSYRWYPATYLDNPSIANPKAKPVNDITYNVIVTNESGCSDTASVSIRIKKPLRIPNTFTPNGDGYNDKWTIGNLELYRIKEVIIFNRFGRKVTSFSNYQNNWDGTVNNVELPVGVYFYHIKTNMDSYRGSLTLLR